jgi:hypothetical protein
MTVDVCVAHAVRGAARRLVDAAGRIAERAAETAAERAAEVAAATQ